MSVRKKNDNGYNGVALRGFSGCFPTIWLSKSAVFALLLGQKIRPLIRGVWLAETLKSVIFS